MDILVIFTIIAENISCFNKNVYACQVKIGFTVKANDTASTAGSVSDLTKKARGSISSLAGGLGGSLLSLGGKEKKNLARLASAVSGKVEKVGNKAKKAASSLKIHKDKNLDTVQEWEIGRAHV